MSGDYDRTTQGQDRTRTRMRIVIVNEALMNQFRLRAQSDRHNCLRSTLLPSTSVERKTVVISREGYLGAFWEIEDVAWHSVHLLARLVSDVKVALQNDFHLVVLFPSAQMPSYMCTIRVMVLGAADRKQHIEFPTSFLSAKVYNPGIKN